MAKNKETSFWSGVKAAWEGFKKDHSPLKLVSRFFIAAYYSMIDYRGDQTALRAEQKRDIELVKQDGHITTQVKDASQALRGQQAALSNAKQGLQEQKKKLNDAKSALEKMQKLVGAAPSEEQVKKIEALQKQVDSAQKQVRQLEKSVQDASKKLKTADKQRDVLTEAKVKLAAQGDVLTGQNSGQAPGGGFGKAAVMAAKAQSLEASKGVAAPAA